MDGGRGTTRRAFLARAAALGVSASVLAAVPAARAQTLPPPDALLAEPLLKDGTLQAFADTLLPGRKATRTDLGQPIHPLAIAGVDDQPGAVEADVLLLMNDLDVGFPALAPPFLADLEARALVHGGPLLTLSYDARSATCMGGLDFDNPLRQVWEAAAGMAFIAFCAAGANPDQVAARASGYRVMGHPGAAPAGYRDASWRTRLARERTRTGSL